jgi:hypothetical protein
MCNILKGHEPRTVKNVQYLEGSRASDSEKRAISFFVGNRISDKKASPSPISHIKRRYSILSLSEIKIAPQCPRLDANSVKIAIVVIYCRFLGAPKVLPGLPVGATDGYIFFLKT